MRKNFFVLLCMFVLGLCALAEGASVSSIEITLGEQTPTGEVDEDGEEIYIDAFDSITEAIDTLGGSDYSYTTLTIHIPEDYNIEDNDNADADNPLFSDYDFGKITSLTLRGNVKLFSPSGARHFSINNSSLTLTLSNLTLAKSETDEDEDEDYDDEDEEDTTGTSGGVEIINAGSVLFENVTFNSLYGTNGGAAVISGGNTTFRGCRFTSSASDNGGVASISNGTVTFSNCNFTSNASGNGGAFDVSGGTVTFSGCSFTSHSSGTGGAVNVTGGTVTFSNNSTFTSYASGSGGAVNISGGTATFNTSKFTSCSTDENGGAVNIIGGSVTFTGSTFTSCTTDGNGGAVNVAGGTTITFDSNTFETCSADNGGAVNISDGTTIAFTGSNEFSRNTASTGGAVNITNGRTITFSGSNEFSDNISYGNGGAVSITGGTSIGFSANNTFLYNIAAENGGAIYASGNSTLTFADTTFTGNSAVLGGALYSNIAMTLNDGMSFATANSADQGGALYVAGKTVTIGGSTEFRGNTANEGGAVYLYRGNITATEAVSFNGNTSTGNGGAVYIASGSQENSFAGDTEFTGNITANTDIEWPDERALLTEGFGGALYVEGIANFTGQADFNNNQALNGGAVYLAGGSVTFSGTSNFGTSTGNKAVNGGALYVSAGSSIFVEAMATFSNNTARNNGGAILVTGDPEKFSFFSSYTYVFSGNKANADNNIIGGGGAIFWGASSAATLTSWLGSASFSENSTGGTSDLYTYGDNTSGSGGALFISADKGALTIGSNYTFEGNSAYNNGGAIYTAANIMFSNSVLGSDNASEANHDGGFAYAEGNINLDSVDIDCSSIRAGNNGGFAYAEGTITITGESSLHSEGSANNADNYGGCTYSEGSTTINSNTTLYGFKAKAGGAIYSGGELTIDSSDIYNNSASDMDSGNTGGGAVYGRSRVTIQYGRFSNNSTNGDFNGVGGGAIFSSGDLEITGTLFTGNTHTAYAGDTSCGGGAIYAIGGLTVTDCIFDNNRVITLGDGGAVYLSKNSASEVSFTNTLFSSDTAAERGGAIFVSTNGILTMDTLSFVNNGTNSGAGGAVYAASQVFNINRSYFYKNAARSREGGGALFFYQSANTINITESVFKENRAQNGDGGAAYIVARSGSILRTTFDSNQASHNSNNTTSDTKAGALYVQTDISSTAGIEIDTCTFVGNQASGGNVAKGGALYTAGLVGSVKVKSSTFTLTNWAVRGRGGAIYVESPMYIVASIVVGNEATNGADIYLEGGLTSGGYNRVGVVSNTATTSTATDWSIVNGDTDTDKTPRDSRPEITEWTSSTFFGSNTLDRNVASNNSTASPKPPLVGVSLEDISSEANSYIETVMLDEDELLPLEVRAMDAIPRAEASRLELATDGIDQRGETRPLPVGGPLDIGAYEVNQPGIYNPENPTQNFAIQSVFMSGIPNVMRSLGQTVALIAMVRYENGMTTYGNTTTEPVTWSSSNPNLIRIDSYGNMTAIAPTPDNDYVTIGVRTRTASDGSYATASQPVRVVLQYSYMNISTEWQTYFAEYVREIAEHDIAVSFADSNSSTISSSSFQKNFKAIWNVNRVRQITEISGITPEFGTSTRSPAGLVPAKSTAVSINYQGRNEGDILPLKYLWTFSKEDLQDITGAEISPASTADEVFPALQIDFEGENGTYTVIGEGGVSANDAVSSGAMTLTPTDGGNGLIVALTVYLANVAATSSNGPQLVKSSTSSLLVVPDGRNDGAITGTMWMDRRSKSSVTVNAQSGISTGESGSGSDSEGGGCEAVGLGLIGAVIFFAFRKK